MPYVTIKDNLLDTDPRFKDIAPASFELQDDSPAFKLGFQRIPFEGVRERFQQYIADKMA